MCPTFIYVSVIKYPDKKTSQGIKGLFSLMIPGHSRSAQGRQDRNYKQVITSHPQSRAEKNEHVYIHLLVCWCSAQSLLSYTIQKPCLGNSTAHSMLCLLPSVNLVKTITHKRSPQLTFYTPAHKTARYKQSLTEALTVQMYVKHFVHFRCSCEVS